MIKGSIPQAMEDKWLCYSDAPDARGAIYVHLCRSWTMAEILVLQLQSANAVDTDQSWIITEITWARKEGKQDLGEEAAKEDAAEICNGVLKCDLPVEDESELDE
ncbi:hypothetical protein VFPPC_18063 [Pochonia chlamydosporia 170]|uniref:Uncharacterized protein n=1 Tax=Pochonia chlamydosporia 170 TaxID=1380566 RepID=A0A219APS6_METCM|nr:hypothetical protein VFPPC_18063 [Pochonia chlamydosporia 170]OWT42808.1 hypothetical protein VFPPC_18063 [Pochonia chlamydosporia 170]